MKLHHFLPHVHTVPFVLSFVLVGAAAVYVTMRGLIASSPMGTRFANTFSSRSTADGEKEAGVASGAYATSTTGHSGNSSFEAYRQSALQRLEDDAAEFHTYLDKLRSAKDKAEFELFFKSRKEPSSNPSSAGGKSD